MQVLVSKVASEFQIPLSYCEKSNQLKFFNGAAAQKVSPFIDLIALYLHVFYYIIQIRRHRHVEFVQ